MRWHVRLLVVTLGGMSLSLALPGRAQAQTASGCKTSACHATVGVGKFVHGPLGVGACEVCHPGGSPKPGAPAHPPAAIGTTAANRALCTQCHDDISQALAQPFPHKPVVGAACGFCHDPHASDRAALLRSSPSLATGEVYCYACHKRAPFQGPLVHKPVSEGQCRACHAVHGGAVKGLLRAPQGAVCKTCHELPWLNAKVLHGPVQAGLCSACHEPHAGTRAHLLKFSPEGFCTNCHGPETESAAHRKGRGGQKDCMGCHDPHGTDTKAMLKKGLRPR